MEQNLKPEILRFAVSEVERIGLAAITRDGLCQKMGIGTGNIGHHFGTMRELRNAIIEEAIKTENLKVLSEGLRLRLIVALGAPQELKEEAIKLLLN